MCVDITNYAEFRFISAQSVIKATGFTKSGLMSAIVRGEFPRPIPHPNNISKLAWVKCEVDAWLRKKVAERDGIA